MIQEIQNHVMTSHHTYSLQDKEEAPMQFLILLRITTKCSSNSYLSKEGTLDDMVLEAPTKWDYLIKIVLGFDNSLGSIICGTGFQYCFNQRFCFI